MSKTRIISAIVFPLSLLFASGVALAGAKTEISTAATHAGLAAQATDVNMVHSHLHHALNCLVGPSGMDYDSKEIDPCKNSGSGAIPDTKSAAKQKSLEAAADKAREGIKASDLSAAQKAASETASMLKAIK